MYPTIGTASEKSDKLLWNVAVCCVRRDDNVNEMRIRAAYQNRVFRIAMDVWKRTTWHYSFAEYAVLGFLDVVTTMAMGTRCLAKW